MAFTITEFQKGLFILDGGFVREFLIPGEDKALLIDTGFPNEDILEAVKSVTDLPVQVALTHGDMDHAGGLKHFGSCLMHEGDRHMIKFPVDTTELKAGEHLHFGNYDFEVIHIPGHTHGSVAFFDEKSGILISGDSIQCKNAIYMFGAERDLPTYIDTLGKLEQMSGRIKSILPSHGMYPLPAEAIGACLKDAKSLLNGQLKSVKDNETPADLYEGEYTSFLYIAK